MDELTELKQLVREVRDLTGPQAYGTANVNVSAGGIGIWLAVTACAMTLAGVLVGAVFVAIHISDLNRQTQELRETNQTIQAYINAGMVNPQKEGQNGE